MTEESDYELTSRSLPFTVTQEALATEYGTIIVS